MCNWTPMCWCMCVKVFLEVATLDISPPLTVVLDGGTAIFPAMTVVDFFPEVHCRVARHWYAALSQQACTRQCWRCMHNGWRTCRRRGVGPLRRWLTLPLMVWRVDGSDDELVNVVAPLLGSRG
jgi:hypothetical protein